jgi:hypothetical protein
MEALRSRASCSIGSSGSAAHPRKLLQRHFRNNFAAHTVHNQGEGRGRTHHSSADDANFHTLMPTSIRAMQNPEISLFASALCSQVSESQFATPIHFNPAIME